MIEARENKPQRRTMGCLISTEAGDADNGAPSTDPSRHDSHAIDQVKNVNQLVTDKFKTNAHHLRNIFTTPLEDIATDYRAPVFEKLPEEEVFIRKALKHNFVFDNLGEKEIKVIVGAHEPYSAQKDATLIKEGDEGDYFYILREGTVKYLKGQKEVGMGTEGSSFGELALLYSAPRAASVVCTTTCHLYRLDQITFRKILQSHVRGEDQEKMKLLQKVPFLKDLDPQDLHKLADAMEPKSYRAGEVLVKKGDEADAFYVIKEGKVKVTDISVGNRKYEDMVFESGDFLGERALLLKEPRAATCFALTDVQTWTIGADTFLKVLGEYTALVLRSQDQVKLSAITAIQNLDLDSNVLASLAGSIKDRKYKKGDVVIEKGQMVPAALYLVRSGQVEFKTNGERKIIHEGGYFGEDQLQVDQELKGKGDPVVKAAYTVTVTEDCTVGILTVEDSRLVFDTTWFGPGRIKPTPQPTHLAQKDLKKHKILGAGTFGQVWLVSHESGGKRTAYALKIQSKYDLIKNNQASGVVNEKDIMAKLKHPFIINLVNTYQDPQRVYMLLGLVQGGELYSVLHTPRRDGVAEREAKFYAAGIIEGLTYMHNKHVVYRDLKPENVLIDAEGYPVIVDMGFAKYVTGKTYTLCGTPLYLPPEVILNRGHDKGADHWSFAVMLYEMMTGVTPFYTEGMDQMALFKSIVKGAYTFPANVRMSSDVKHLLEAMIVTDPSRRLGSLAEGSKGIFHASWFHDIDFHKLRRKEIKAPWKPKIKDPLDGSNFEDWSHLKDKDKDEFPPLSEKQQKIFETF